MTEMNEIDCSPELEEAIRKRIREGDGIPFRDYMELCLYHPTQGYYMRQRDRIGKEGDFFTSSSVHELFGRLIARQLRQMWDILGSDVFTVVEQGPGEGHFAHDILNALCEEHPDLYERIEYLLVEISPDNRDRQKALLKGHLDKVQWRVIDEIGDVEGCFLSNELVDSFPVHVVEKQNGLWKEVFVVEKGEGFAEELRPLSTPAIEKHFDWLGVSPVEGCRAEVNLDAVRWIKDLSSRLARGFVLTIDYGYPASELYAPFRKNGTLLCYYKHSTSDDPFERAGLQDMTSHIDFTAIEKAGESAGLSPLYFGEQYRFLMGLGFVEELIALQARETDENRALALRMTLKNLILPEGGMGETFKVLMQGKGVGTPSLLCARAISDIPLPMGGMI